MADLFVYHLEFDEPDRLQAAFVRVSEHWEVASCMVEPEERRIRFLAPPVTAQALVEQIYADGGLRWCSSHAFRAPAVSTS